jgi:hypothetical protein
LPEIKQFIASALSQERERIAGEVKEIIRLSRNLNVLDVASALENILSIINKEK